MIASSHERLMVQDDVQFSQKLIALTVAGSSTTAICNLRANYGRAATIDFVEY